MLGSCLFWDGNGSRWNNNVDTSIINSPISHLLLGGTPNNKSLLMMICGTGFTSLPKFGQEWEDVEGEHLSIISNTLLQESQHQALSAWLRMTTIPTSHSSTKVPLECCSRNNSVRLPLSQKVGVELRWPGVCQRFPKWTTSTGPYWPCCRTMKNS